LEENLHKLGPTDRSVRDFRDNKIGIFEHPVACQIFSVSGKKLCILIWAVFYCIWHLLYAESFERTLQRKYTHNLGSA
jgi:hypothetical protein